MGWWDSASWAVKVLGEQDHLGEFSQLSGVPLDAITGHPKNKDRKTTRPAPGAAVDPSDLPFQPGDSVFLPQGPPAAHLPVQQGASNAFTGALPEMTVEIRFRALRLPPKWKEVPHSTAAGQAMSGGSAQARWAVQWQDFLARAEEVEADAGLSFKLRRLLCDPNASEADATADATKDWFTSDRSFNAGQTIDLVSKVWSGGPKRLLVQPVVTSKLYGPAAEVRLEQSLHVAGFFAHLDSAYLVRRVVKGRPPLAPTSPPDYAGAFGDALESTVGKPTPPLLVPDYLLPRLVKLGLFKRTFEIVYRLPYQRGKAAFFSARREVDRGAKKYDVPLPRKTWWDLPQKKVKQAGTLINEYRLWPKVTYRQQRPAATDNNPSPSFDPYDYATWSKDPGTPAAIQNDPVIFKSEDAPNDNENWCGFFHGFNYTRAGFDNRDAITASSTIEHLPRYGVFASGQKLFLMFDLEERPWCRFPKELAGRSAADRETWIKRVLNPWGPRPGDIIVVNPFWSDGKFHEMDHVAMVHGYDPGTYMLTTLEGNRGGDTVQWTWAGCWNRDAPLTDVHVYSGIFGIGRFFEGDFDRGVDPDLVQAVKDDDDHLGVKPETLLKGKAEITKT